MADWPPFFFSSDFPHEVNAAMCAREIREIAELEDLGPSDRDAILGTNARRFYAMDPPDSAEAAGRSAASPARS